MLHRLYSEKLSEVALWLVKLMITAFSVAVLPWAAAADDQPAKMSADSIVTIGASISFDSKWLIHAKEKQYEFISTLMQQEQPVIIDTIPRNRLVEMINGENLDCILSATKKKIEKTFKSKHQIVFEIELFRHKDTDVSRLSFIRIGLLAHLPKPTIPLAAELEWYPLRSIEQGVRLLAERRLDLIVADGTRVSMIGNEWVVPSGFPAVRTSKISLICRETKPLQDFVDAFDYALDLLGNASGVGFFQPEGFSG